MPINDLVADAVKNRVEMQQANINLESNKMDLDRHQEFSEADAAGLRGIDQQRSERPWATCPAFSGGYGNLLAQIFRRDYPNYSAGLSLNIPLRNRAAQADYATSLIGIRQNELNLQKQINQVRVDVQNAVIGLQQARVRYDAAVEARKLSQQTFDADKKKYDLGAGHSLSGGAGSARSGQRAKLGGAGDGELQPRPHRVRSGAGQDARGQSHLDG